MVNKVDYISGGHFERFLLLVFASLVDVDGKIFYQKIVKIKACQAISLKVLFFVEHKA